MKKINILSSALIIFLAPTFYSFIILTINGTNGFCELIKGNMITNTLIPQLVWNESKVNSIAISIILLQIFWSALHLTVGLVLERLASIGTKKEKE